MVIQNKLNELLNCDGSSSNADSYAGMFANKMLQSSARTSTAKGSNSGGHSVPASHTGSDHQWLALVRDAPLKGTFMGFMYDGT